MTVIWRGFEFKRHLWKVKNDNFNQVIGEPEISGGGILLDQGIHLLDLMNYFAGGFNKVFSIIQNSFWNFDVEDNAFVLMQNDFGVVGQLHSSATQWRHKFHLDVTLKKGSLILGGLLTGSKSYGDETLKIIYADPENDKGNPKEEIIHFDEDISWDEEIRDLQTLFVILIK